MTKSLRVFALFIFCSIVFIGCDNEPLSEDINLEDSTINTVNVAEDDIIGNWQVSDQVINVNQTITGSFDGIPINSSQNINLNQESGDITITFNEDGTFTSQGSANVVITGTQDGFAIPESTETVESPFSSGTWTASNGILTMTNSGGVNEFFIISFGGNTMILFSNEDLPILSDLTLSGAIPDISDIPGFEDFPALSFEVEQDVELEFELTKVE